MTVYGGIDDYIERGVPVMSAVEIGALERQTSEAHGVIDAYDASYWEPMTRSGSVNPPITRLFEGEVLSVGGYNLRVLQTPRSRLASSLLIRCGERAFGRWRPGSL